MAQAKSDNASERSVDSQKKGLPARVGAVADRVKKLKPVRVFLHYGATRGPLLAAGLSYQSIFAIFAALWVGFSVAGLFLQAQPELRKAFFDLIDTSVPGLIDTGAGKGIIDPKVLLEARALSWTGAIALGGLLFTALGWLSSCRDAVRTIFNLPSASTNFLLLKLKDLALAIGFGIALLVSAALSVLSTQAIGAVLDFFGIDHRSFVATALLRGVGLLLVLALDTGVLAALFRVLSGLTIPAKPLFTGSLFGAIGLGVLQVLGSSLLGGASRNPLLTSFAAIIGLLIWFNLISQVILISSAWIAVGVDDRGIVVDAKVAAARARAEEKEREEIEREIAEAERRRPWYERLFTRRTAAKPRPREPEPGEPEDADSGRDSARP